MATPYCTEARFALLGLNANTTANVPPGTLAAALLAASSVVDSYLIKLSTPLAVVPESIERAAAIIAAYDVMCVQGYAPEQEDADTYYQRYKEVIRWLEGLQGGAKLPGAGQSPTASGQVMPGARARLGRPRSGWSGGFP